MLLSRPLCRHLNVTRQFAAPSSSQAPHAEPTCQDVADFSANSLMEFLMGCWLWHHHRIVSAKNRVRSISFERNKPSKQTVRLDGSTYEIVKVYFMTQRFT